MNLLKTTLCFATNAHTGQFRKDGHTPYIVHPVAVAMHAAQFGLPLEVQQAALLHDVLEDTEVIYQELSANFGNYVAGLVQELTNISKQPEHENKPRVERKRLDREAIAGASKYAQMLKMLDRIDNLQDLYNFHTNFQQKYLAESELLYKAIFGANQQIAEELMQEIIQGYNRMSLA